MSPKQHRSAIKLWFEKVSTQCAYCGTEMVPYKEAFRLNQRNTAKNRSKYTRVQRQRADNHPTVDHVVPTALGGSGKMKNYAICCERCNHSKDAQQGYRLGRDLRALWFETIDNHIIAHDGTPYPDPHPADNQRNEI